MKRILNIYLIAVLICCGSLQVYGQSLDSLLMIVVENNPELKALNSEYEAELQRVNQVGVLPNPTVGLGVPILRPETRLGPQLMMVTASQMFPWFGTLGAKEDVVILMSKAKFERIAALRIELFYLVKSSYYNLNFFRIKRNLIDKKIILYNTVETISLANIESGKSSIADVLRIQLVIRELRKQLEIIDNTILSFQFEINQVLNRELQEQIQTPIELDQKTLIDFDTTTYRLKISEHHPLVAKLDMQIEASKNLQIVNDKMNSPVLGVGLDYSWVGKRTDANPISNGRDILIPKVMITIPIYRKDYNAKNQEELLHQEAFVYEKEALIDKIIRMLLQYKLEYDNALLEINYFKEQIITTNQIIEILLTNYSSTGDGFDDLLQLENQLIYHEIGLIKGQLDKNLSIAKIERLTDF